MILIIDVFNACRWGLILDIRHYYKFDFKYTSTDYGPYYSQFSEPGTYDRFKQYTKQDLCTICLEKYQENDIRSLLICGHLFHKQCIEKYENNKWNFESYSTYKYPKCACPCCKSRYDAKYEKYLFNPNYDQNDVHILRRTYYYPGQQILNRYIWKNTWRDYKKHCQYVWKNHRKYWR